MLKLDKIDRTILTFLQTDCTLSITELAEKVNLTTTPCWKRIKRLEDEGVIKQRVALINPDTIGLTLTAFVMLKTRNHSQDWFTEFVNEVVDFAQVMEFYRMAGEYDYMMKVQVADMQAFDHFYKQLVNSVDGISDVTSTFAMESLKYTTQFPVD